MQTTIKHVMWALNPFVFAVGLSALGKGRNKKIMVHYFQQWQEVGFQLNQLKKFQLCSR